MVKEMIENQIYYCILQDGTLHIVSESYYSENRKDLTAIAVGTIDEINKFLWDLGVMLDEGDE